MVSKVGIVLSFRNSTDVVSRTLNPIIQGVTNPISILDKRKFLQCNYLKLKGVKQAHCIGKKFKCASKSLPSRI